MKKRFQIGMRECTDSRHKLFPVVILAAAFFAAMCVSSFLLGLGSTEAEGESLLTFTGDTAIARYTETLAEKNGYESLFEGVKDVWKNSEFVFTNLEYTVIFNDHPANKKRVVLSGTTESLTALRDAGVNVFSIANNHSSDYGTEGFDDEVSYLDANGYIFSGATDRPYEKLVCSDGTTIGFFAAVDQSTSETALSPHVTKVTTELYSDVNESAKENDLTIVYLHCGTENTFAPEQVQKEYAHNLIDAGADIVLEMHAHVLLPVEKYKGGIIFYGLGNFIFDQEMTSQRNGVIVQYNKGYFELIPLRIRNGYTRVTKNRFYIKQINAVMTKYLDDYYVNEAGHVIIPWE